MTMIPTAHRLQSLATPAIAVAVIAGASLIGGGMSAVTGSPIAIFATAAVALGALLLLRPELGSIVFLGLLWVNAPAVLTTFHGVPSMVAGATIALLLVPVGRYLLQREPVLITPAFVAVLAYVGANFLSAAASSNPPQAAELVITLLSEGLLVYILVSNAVRTPRVAQLAVWTLVFTAVAMGGLAIHQEVTRAYDDPYLGFAQNNLQEDAVNPIGNDARPRMAGPIGEKNRFAQVLLVVLPLALFGLGLRHPFWRRVVPAAASVVILAGIFLTFSRGAAVGLAMIAVVLVVRRYVRLSHMLAMTVAFALTIMIVAPEFVGRVGSLGAVAGWVSGEGEDADGAVVGRTTSNIAALLVFVDYPAIGVGPGVYAEDYSVEYANRLGLRFFVEERRAHNMYLEWAAELGLIGLAAGVAMIGITLVQLASLRSFWLVRRRDYADLAGAFSLALIAYAATAIFLHLSYIRYFFTLLALANAVIWILQRERYRVGAQPAVVTGEKPIAHARDG